MTDFLQWVKADITDYLTKTAITFIASDNELLNAAKTARLKSLNPQDYPDGDTLRA